MDLGQGQGPGSDPRRVAVTGASGFIGRHLCERLRQDAWSVLALTRSAGPVQSVGALCLGPIESMSETEWAKRLAGQDAVVHLAARVHQIHEDPQAAEALHTAVNRHATERLARGAALAGVKRFVFLSTAKVFGERTPIDQPFGPDSPAAPEDPYARSKWAAEQAVVEVADQHGLGLTILRPPLVYGPGAGANFLALLRAIDRGLPLPLAGIRNRRSLIYVGNLVDLIVRSLTDTRALGQTLVAADDSTLSTPELARHLARALGRSDRLWPLPSAVLNLAGHVAGRKALVRRLTDSLVLDASATRRLLDWQPPVSPVNGLEATAIAYRAGGT